MLNSQHRIRCASSYKVPLEALIELSSCLQIKQVNNVMKNFIQHKSLRIVSTYLALVTCTHSLAEEPVFTEITDSPISENYAFSAAWGDYDQDGYMDVLLVDPYQGVRGSTQIYLLKNQGNGSFSKTILNDSEFLHSGYLNGASWGDYDNDGRLDILIDGGGLWNAPERSILLHHESDGSFVRSSSPSFQTGNTQSGLWGDFDNNGLLDIFTGHWTGGDNPTVTDILYTNVGDGRFIDSQAIGISELNNNDNSAMAATTGDFNGDGFIDILVTTISPDRSRIYFNNGNLSFERHLVTPTAPGFSQNWAHGLAVADYDNDGDLDFLTVSKSGAFGWSCACDGELEGRTMVWRNNGFGEFENVVAGDLGNDDSIGANSGAWADYNNDGWLDIVLFRGAYSDGRYNEHSDLLYRNNGDGTFTRIETGAIANENGDARSGAWADYDNDGDMDLVIANYNWQAAEGSDELPALYQNEGNANHWLKVSLVGTTSNRDAIGAKVKAIASIGGKEISQLREIRSQEGWIVSQNDMRPHFGLGDTREVKYLRVEWPSGTVQEFNNVAADQIIRIVEPPRLDWEDNLKLSWSANTVGFVLESAPSINGPWEIATEVLKTSNGRVSTTIAPNNSIKFFRLHDCQCE